jgi:hypothetical protein
MYYRCVISTAAVFAVLTAAPARGATVYNNLTPNNSVATASRPGSGGGVFEIESADDFFLQSQTLITNAHFTGLLVASGAAPPSVNQVVVEIYRIFPLDSTLPGGGGVRVPTRTNSPSDVELDGRDSAASGLTFATTQLAASFTALNSVTPGGIHTMPNNLTLGNGAQTGAEVQFDVSFNTPFNLAPGQYFFVPQVGVTGGTFFWLSASRPISGAGTTPFPAGLTDLQSWTRDAALDPDWLRVGADIIGGGSTFNAAFSLDGTAIPEPGSWAMLAGGIALLAMRLRKR